MRIALVLLGLGILSGCGTLDFKPAEIGKNGRAAAGAQKTMALKVNSLESRYGHAMFWRSSIQFEATLGNGQVVSFDVPHTSGSPQQNLNGNIAEGVMTMLRDERVRAYLGS